MAEENDTSTEVLFEIFLMDHLQLYEIKECVAVPQIPFADLWGVDACLLWCLLFFDSYFI